MNSKRLGAAAAVAAALFTAAAAPLAAQDFPSRPIRVVVPYGPGTSTDLQARFVAQELGKLVDQPVFVENKPGANGIVGTQYSMTLPADGYTIVFGGTTSHAGNVSLYKSLPYDPLKDFIPVSGVAIGGGAFVVSPESPIKNVSDLIALAKKEPGKYTYGWASAFSRVAFGSLTFQSGIDLLDVPYKGNISLATEVMSGTVNVAFEPIVTLLPLIKGGKLRSIGVSSAQRAPGLEEVPTVAEQGLPNYEFLGWLCVFAKDGTPAPIVERLNTLINTVLKTPRAAEFFRQSAVWEPMVMTPAETRKFVEKEIELWRQGVVRAGIEPQ
jgi:tripartite-type tricarboxylate transporter receptor subunit TctC